MKKAGKKIMAALLCVSMLVGCGKASKEDIAEDLGKNNSDEIASGSEALGEMEQLPETISFLVEDELGNVYYDKDLRVVADGYGRVPTYALDKSAYDDEWLRDIAERFFDDGEYTNIKPFQCNISIDELNDEKAFFEELAAKYADNEKVASYMLSRAETADWYIQNYEATDLVTYPKDKLMYPFDEYYSDDECESRYYGECATLFGLHDGKLWELNYVSENNYDMYYKDNVEYQRKGPHCISGTCIETKIEANKALSINVKYAENSCDITTAEKDGEKFIEELGISDMGLVKINHMQPWSEEEADPNTVKKVQCDGYIMVYGYTKNGAHIGWPSNTNIYIDEEFKSPQPGVIVNVNENGVYGFCIVEDYKLSVMAEKSEMITLEQANEIAKTTWLKLLKEEKNAPRVGKVEFQYICVTYDGEKFALLPAWVYYTDSALSENYANFAVCALDGAVFYYDYSDINLGYQYGWTAYIN